MYRLNFLNRHKATKIFSFILKLILVTCVFQGIYPFYVSDHTYWQKIINTFPIVLLMAVGFLVMSPLSFLAFVSFLFSSRSAWLK